jgi:hypothetical protein
MSLLELKSSFLVAVGLRYMSTINRRASKRRRRRAPLGAYAPNPREEKLFMQAIQNSKMGSARSKEPLDIPYAPVFYPTVEDMEGSPLSYVEKIRPLAQKYGIAKIVPPKGWAPPFSK